MPAFATKAWLERNVLAGNGEVRECQRRTKAFGLAKEAERESVAMRKVFLAESGLLAAVVAGRVADAKYDALYQARNYAACLAAVPSVAAASVVVPVFTCDAATGVWHALVLFHKGGEA